MGKIVQIELYVNGWSILSTSPNEFQRYITIGSLCLETWLSNGLLTHLLEAARSGALPKNVLAKACNYTMTL